MRREEGTRMRMECDDDDDEEKGWDDDDDEDNGGRIRRRMRMRGIKRGVMNEEDEEKGEEVEE